MPVSSSISRRQIIASALSMAAFAAMPSQARTSPEPHSQLQKPKGEEMTTLMPYLLFDGSCGQAMEFYRSVFGGELSLTKVKDSPAKAQMQPFQQDKVLNARLKSSNLEISASDWLLPNETPVRGNTVCLFLNGGTLPELKALFEKLSAGANVTNPLKEQFLGFYGALNDKFGVRWMFWTNAQNG